MRLMHLDSWMADVNLYLDLNVSLYISLLGLKIVFNVIVNAEDAPYCILIDKWV